jgi:hypothetical protein
MLIGRTKKMVVFQIDRIMRWISTTRTLELQV